MYSAEGCLLCGWKTPGLNSVTDSACVNTNSTVWITNCLGDIFPFAQQLLEPQQYHSQLHCEYFINIVCKRCS